MTLGMRKCAEAPAMCPWPGGKRPDDIADKIYQLPVAQWAGEIKKEHPDIQDLVWEFLRSWKGMRVKRRGA